MELNFSELDNMTNQNPYQQFHYNTDFEGDNDSEKYWQQSNIEAEKKTKKRISFNDILSNMNLVVNKNGVLQSMQSARHTNDYQNQMQYTEQLDYQQQYPQQQKQYPQQQKQYPQQQKQYPQQQKQYPHQQKQYSQQQQPIDPSVKHSYIYNKYFKDYADANNNSVPEKKIPHTVEEYNQMVLEERIKTYEQRKRIAEIKSKKLMFTTNPENPINPRNIQPSRNNLRTINKLI